MGMPRRWLNNVRRKLGRLSPGDIVVLPSNTRPGAAAADEAKSSEATGDVAGYQRLRRESIWPSTNELTKEDMAATKIQSVFRGHLARQAFRALRSLVKLQALVRGAYVRKQSRIALHCMHALVRLQVRVRARQLLSRCSDDD